MERPDFFDVLEARQRIRPYLATTPLYRYPALDELLGAEVYIKHENYHPVGAFKVRGGVNLIAQLSPEERAAGVLAASTGNHGQSVAYAARLFGVKACIVVPERANPGKVAAMRGMGAEVIFHGANFDEAKVYCEGLARQEGGRYIHSGDEPMLIAGVGTAYLEMLEEQPRIEAIFAPIGGGSGASGACIVAAALNPAIRVIGVQAAASPAAYESWRRRSLVSLPNHTFAEGLATGTPFALPQAILRDMLADFVLVSEEDILRAIFWLVERAHTLAEGAGAAALAAAYNMREDLRSKKIGVVVSGGNSSVPHLLRALHYGTGSSEGTN